MPDLHRCREVEAALDGHRALIDDALSRSLASTTDLPEVARQALRAATAGGKRIRPTITLLACELVGGDIDAALDAAVAIEFIHCASLTVDDVIDEDDIRHGQETLHVRFGTDLAVMVAMVLVTRALRLVMHHDEIIAEAIAAVDDLSIGECMDIRSGNVDALSYVSMAGKKTGALFRLAAESGAILGGADPEQRCALRTFGHNLGIAFQIRDDVLNAAGDEEALGKPVGTDVRLGRPSMVSVLLSEKLGVALPMLAGALAALSQPPASSELAADRPAAPVLEAVDDAMRACRGFVEQASDALATLPQSAPRRHLAGLLDYAVNRGR
jgi:geranylgeranyl diphosphate synthase, type I